MLLPFLAVFLNDFANHRAAIPHFNLVNQPSLDKILQAEVFIHKDGQLWVTHLILGHTLLTSSFQALKCVIKAKDPHLHQIRVVVPAFLITDPIPEGIPKIELPSQHTTKEEATSSQPTTKEEEETVEVSDSEEDFKVFNQPLSLETSIGDLDHLPPTPTSHAQEDSSISEAMGIQRKPKVGLMDVIETQPESKAPEKTIQAKLPPPPSSLPPWPDPADHKRKRDQRGPEVVEGGKGPFPKKAKL